jgi:hypothetical protein
MVAGAARAIVLAVGLLTAAFGCGGSKCNGAASCSGEQIGGEATSSGATSSGATGSGATNSGATGGGATGNGTSGSGPQVECPPECLVAITCVKSCGAKPVSVGCCPCVDPAFDARQCN